MFGFTDSFGKSGGAARAGISEAGRSDAMPGVALARPSNAASEVPPHSV